MLDLAVLGMSVVVIVCKLSYVIHEIVKTIRRYNIFIIFGENDGTR